METQKKPPVKFYDIQEVLDECEQFRAKNNTKKYPVEDFGSALDQILHTLDRIEDKIELIEQQTRNVIKPKVKK